MLNKSMNRSQNYQELLSRGYRVQYPAGPNKNKVLRAWMDDLIEYQPEITVDLELLRLWGWALGRVLSTTTPEYLEHDSKLVGQYFSHLCLLPKEIFMQNSVPLHTATSSHPDQPSTVGMVQSWATRPLFENTRTIFLTMAKIQHAQTILCNSVDKKQFSLDSLMELLWESDNLVFPNGIRYQDFQRTGRAALNACIPPLLCHSQWRPPSENIDRYALSWLCIDTHGSQRFAYIKACKNAFPTSTDRRLQFLGYNPELGLLEVNALFPLFTPGLLDATALGILVFLYMGREKHSTWRNAVQAFEKHHADLADIVKFHLSICPDGQPLEVLAKSLRAKIQSASTPEPETFSIENLGL